MSAWENARLAGHYLRTTPGLATRALIISPLLGLVVCSWRGHRQGNLARILGMCDRCLGALPAAASAHMGGFTDAVDTTGPYAVGNDQQGETT